jgi:hypothetical protein
VPLPASGPLSAAGAGAPPAAADAPPALQSGLLLWARALATFLPLFSSPLSKAVALAALVALLRAPGGLGSAAALRYPSVYGPSRKAFLGALTGRALPSERAAVLSSRIASGAISDAWTLTPRQACDIQQILFLFHAWRNHEQWSPDRATALCFRITATTVRSSGTYRLDDFTVDGDLVIGLGDGPKSTVAVWKQQASEVGVSFQNSGIATLSVIDLVGHIHQTTTVKGNEATLDLSHLPKGIYYLHLQASGSRIVRKIALR